MSSAARELVERHEAGVGAAVRHDDGVHYTPPDVGRLVVDEAIEALGRIPRTVCDPTCGAGSFLLAAADALLAAGVPPREVVEDRLHGAELDPAAAAVAREALAVWAAEHGVSRCGPLRVVVGESLLRRPEEWSGRPRAGFDLVVGNPPFQSQLGRRTARSAAQRDAVRERFGVDGYADAAALFLLAAVDLLAADGVVAMVQPQSFLSARDTTEVRDRLLRAAELAALWASDDELFDAAVRVCAPVLRRGPNGVTPVRVLWDVPATSLDPVGAPAPGASWGPLLAAAHGIPAVAGRAGPALGSVATATAGFRDEYYALRDAAVEAPDPRTFAAGAADEVDVAGACSRPLVTVGMVEPGWCDWGVTPRRFGGRMWQAPVLDATSLERAAPRVRRWAAARQVPKVLVATQTRVVEAVADPTGHAVPVTPLISVEPHRGAPDVYALTAALLAPPVSAAAVALHLGSGLSAGALRWSASAVLDVALPSEPDRWAEGEARCRALASAPAGERPALLAELGAVMCEAHGLDRDDPVLDWWVRRAVRR